MKKIYNFVEKYSFILVLLFLIVVIFRPVILYRQIPFSSNLLVSFFNPWAQEKFPHWEQGIPNKPVGIDDLRIFYPQRHLTVSEYQQGILPLWNPYNFSGNYQAGLSETAVFYPLFFLFLFLPQLPTWILLIILEPIAMTVGTYLFLRRLNLQKSSAIFGSIVFGFSGLVMVRMVEGLSVGHTLLWIPFILYAIESFFQTKRLRYLLVLLVALCCTLFGGWFQFAFYNILLGGLYAFYRFILEKNKKTYWVVFMPFLITPFLTLFHIVPALESFSLSSRGATTTQELLNLHLMPLSHVLTYIFPDFWGNPGSYNFFGRSEYKESILYIGVTPFILSLFGLFSSKKNKQVLFFSGISIIGILLGIDNPVTRSILSLPIPIISSFLPNRVFYFATVGLSILSAYGFEALFAKKLSFLKIMFVTVVVGLLCIIANGYIFLPRLSAWHIIGQQYQMNVAKHNLYLPDILVVAFLGVFLIGRFISKKLLLAGIFILTIVGQIYFAQKYIPFSQSQFVFPPNDVFTYLQYHAGIDRFISIGNGYIASNSPLFYNLYSPDGVGSMYLGRYGELVTYMQTRGKDTINIPRIEIRIDPSADEALSGTNPYLLRFMQIDGIKFVLHLKSDSATVNTKLFTKVWSNKMWEVYAYKNVLPRIFWTNEFVIQKNDEKNITATYVTSGKTILLKKDPGFREAEGEGHAKVMEYKPNEIQVRTNSSTNGLVYISDNDVPQWKAYVDGQKVSLLRANYSFMAVPVTKGQHTVVLRYQDTKEILAFGSAGVTAIICVVGVVYMRKKKYL